MSKYIDVEMLELKRKLYHAILNKKKPTDSEIRVAFEICRDPDIQKLLTERMTPAQSGEGG